MQRGCLSVENTNGSLLEASLINLFSSAALCVFGMSSGGSAWEELRALPFRGLPPQCLCWGGVAAYYCGRRARARPCATDSALGLIWCRALVVAHPPPLVA